MEPGFHQRRLLVRFGGCGRQRFRGRGTWVRYWRFSAHSSALLWRDRLEAELRSEERRVGKECRSRCDWSSDVCSSDLLRSPAVPWSWHLGPILAVLCAFQRIVVA